MDLPETGSSQSCLITVDIAQSCRRRAVSESPTRVCLAHAGGIVRPPSSPRLDDVIARTAASCRCFMFRAWRRAALTRRLAKRRIDPGSDLPKCIGDGDMVATDATNLLYSVVGLFDDHQLEVLVDAVEMGHSSGRSMDCVVATVPAGWPVSLPPHIACCRLWRWPSLDGPESLKQMPWCRCSSTNGEPSSASQQNDRPFCCNPFHWSRLVLPGNYCSDEFLVLHWVCHENLTLVNCSGLYRPYSTENIVLWHQLVRRR